MALRKPLSARFLAACQYKPLIGHYEVAVEFNAAAVSEVTNESTDVRVETIRVTASSENDALRVVRDMSKDDYFAIRMLQGHRAQAAFR